MQAKVLQLLRRLRNADVWEKEKGCTDMWSMMTTGASGIFE
jgi:hypothetical protein